MHIMFCLYFGFRHEFVFLFYLQMYAKWPLPLDLPPVY